MSNIDKTRKVAWLLV